MRILVLTPDVPNPPYGGGQLRCFHIVKQLAARHEIFLLGIHRSGDAEKYSEIAQFCAGVRTVTPSFPRYQRPRFAALQSLHWRLYEMRRKPEAFLNAESPDLPSLIQQTIQQWKPDVVQVETCAMGQHLLNLPRGGESLRALMMYDVVAHIEQQKMFRAQSRAERLKCWMDWRKTWALEKRICRSFDLCFTMSESDRASVQRWYGRDDVLVSPNGVDVQANVPLPSEDSAKSEMLFTGLMAYAPNHDACLWFCRDILPLVQRQIPDAHLTVMGRYPKPEVEALASKQVTVTGGVEDATPFFQRAAVCVVPLRLGSGTRLKILEAFAKGKAVVSTTLGAEGLEAVDGQHLLIADDPASFAAAVVRLLKDADLRQRMGQAARALVEQRYDWRQIVENVERAYEEALSRKNRAVTPFQNGYTTQVSLKSSLEEGDSPAV